MTRNSCPVFYWFCISFILTTFFIRHHHLLHHRPHHATHYRRRVAADEGCPKDASISLLLAGAKGREAADHRGTMGRVLSRVRGCECSGWGWSRNGVITAFWLLASPVSIRNGLDGPPRGDAARHARRSSVVGTT